jgi:hypothetical protein
MRPPCDRGGLDGFGEKLQAPKPGIYSAFLTGIKGRLEEANDKNCQPKANFRLSSTQVVRHPLKTSYLPSQGIWQVICKNRIGLFTKGSRKKSLKAATLEI